MATTSHFYITLLSNASRDIYKQNTHADFMEKVSQPVDLSSTSSWELGLFEITFSTPPLRRKRTNIQ